MSFSHGDDVDRDGDQELSRRSPGKPYPGTVCPDARHPETGRGIESGAGA